MCVRVIQFAFKLLQFVKLDFGAVLTLGVFFYLCMFFRYYFFHETLTVMC